MARAIVVVQALLVGEVNQANMDVEATPREEEEAAIQAESYREEKEGAHPPKLTPVRSSNGLPSIFALFYMLFFDFLNNFPKRLAGRTGVNKEGRSPWCQFSEPCPKE